MSERINLELSANLDMVYADELKRALCEAVEQAQEVRLEAAAVEQVGSSCIQLLVAASRSLEAANGRLRLDNPSSCLVEALVDLGLHDELHSWSAKDA